MSVLDAENRKCYGQFCPMATALDVIGDRWTILILRELLGGAARFQDLHEGLPGIAKNLLTDRLRRLESDGLVRRVRSHNAALYALSERGAATRALLEELAFWGATLAPIRPPQHPRSIRAIAMALQALLARAGNRLPEVRHVVELEIEGEHMRIVLDARPSASVGPSTDADTRIHVDRSAMAELLSGQPVDEKRFVRVSGEEPARTALLRALGVVSS